MEAKQKKLQFFPKTSEWPTRPNGEKPLGGWHRSAILLGFTWHRSLIGLQATGSTGSASCDSQHVGEPERWHHISPKGAVTDLVGCFFVCTRIYLCLMVPHFHVNLDHTCFTYKNDVCVLCFFFKYSVLHQQSEAPAATCRTKERSIRGRKFEVSYPCRARGSSMDFQWGGGGVGEGFCWFPKKTKTRFFCLKNIDVSLYFLTWCI